MSDTPTPTPLQVINTFDWTNRRRWIWRTTVFCMFVVTYCLLQGEDLRLYETALTSAFTLLGFLGGSYVAGAAWENRSFIAGVTRRPPKDEEQ